MLSAAATVSSFCAAPVTSNRSSGSYLGLLHEPATSSSALFAAGGSEGDESDEQRSSLEGELEYLQNQFALIEALEERNKSQLDSFIDEQDQWDSMEEEERLLLQQKESIIQRMEQLAEELVRMWMGTKSIDG